jgi:hypothetical protein
VRVTFENLVDELKTGVLLCNILKFHQPNLDFAGLNTTVRTKKPCINNLEKAISIMYQKGVPSRYVLSAEEIFEGSKVDRIWLLLQNVFEVFAMHDVNVLKPKITAWINTIVQFYNPFLQLPLRGSEFYSFFKSGLPLFYIFFLYLTEENVKPKPELFFEHPQNRAEYLSNLNYVVQLQYKFNLPIYLTP